MARLIYSESAFADLEQLVDFYVETDPELAVEAVSRIQEAVQILQRHPLIGRDAESGMRELIISHGRTGFVALYDFLPEYDVVRVLAVRHQREAGYPSPRDPHGEEPDHGRQPPADPTPDAERRCLSGLRRLQCPTST